MSVKDFEVILGTYEEFLVGYKVQENDKGLSLVQSFATHEHSGSIRSVAVGKQFMASGASDDRIFIYDLHTRREHTVLTHHSGTVNTVVFCPGNTHLLSGSEDGSLAVIRTGNWQLEKIWTKSHGGSSVRLISSHPSGKLALSIGNDGTLRTWNLVKGRQAFVIRLSPMMKQTQNILWVLDGQKLILTSNRFIELWDITKGGCEIHIERPSSVVSIAWICNQILVGHEDGSLAIIGPDLNEISVFYEHKSRIRCLTSYENWLVSADSSGLIVLWLYVDNKLKKLTSISVGCRITCAVISGPQVATKIESNILYETVEKEIEKSSESDQQLKKSRVGKVEVIVSDEEDNENVNYRYKKSNKKINTKKTQTQEKTDKPFEIVEPLKKIKPSYSTIGKNRPKKQTKNLEYNMYKKSAKSNINHIEIKTIKKSKNKKKQKNK